MHSGNGNIKLASYNDVNEVVDELLASLRSRYQGNLEISVRGSDFFFFFLTWWFMYRFSRLDKKEESNNKSKK